MLVHNFINEFFKKSQQLLFLLTCFCTFFLPLKAFVIYLLWLIYIPFFMGPINYYTNTFCLLPLLDNLLVFLECHWTLCLFQNILFRRNERPITLVLCNYFFFFNFSGISLQLRESQTCPKCLQHYFTDYSILFIGPVQGVSFFDLS